MNHLIKFFDRLEDHAREFLSRWPITYALIGGLFTVLFWRGGWHTADALEGGGGFIGTLFSGPVQIILSLVALLLTGLLVSVFIGDRIIISGLKHEKKVTEKTEKEVREEEETMRHILNRLREIDSELKYLRGGGEGLTKK